MAAAIAAPGTALVAPSVQFAPRMVESPFGEAGGMRCPLALRKFVDSRHSFVPRALYSSWRLSAPGVVVGSRSFAPRVVVSRYPAACLDRIEGCLPQRTTFHRCVSRGGGRGFGSCVRGICRKCYM